MKEKILSIASDLRDSRITSYEAKNLLLGLFGVSGSVPNLNREKDLEESLSVLIEMASTWGREWFKSETWDKVEKAKKVLAGTDR